MSPIVASATVFAQINDSSSQWSYVAAGYGLVVLGIIGFYVIYVTYSLVHPVREPSVHMQWLKASILSKR